MGAATITLSTPEQPSETEILNASLPTSELKPAGLRPATAMAAVLLACLAATCSLYFATDVFVGMLVLSFVVMLAVLLLRPTWATSMFLFISYTNAPAVAVKFHNVPPVIAGSSILLLLVPIFYYVVIRREKFYLDEIVPWLLAYSAVQMLCASLSEFELNSFAVLTTFLIEGLLMYLLTINAVRNRSVVWALIAAGVFMGSLGIFQSVTGQYWRDFKGFALVAEPDLNAYGEIIGGRWPAGPIGDKNYYAQFMLMLFPLCIAQFFNEKALLWRWGAFVAGAIILIGMGLTGSRGAAVGFAAMMLLMVTLRYVTLRHATLLAVGAMILLLAMPAYRERVVSIFDVMNVMSGEDIRQTDPATKGRLTEMVAAVLVFAEHPLFGVGPGNFPTYFVEKADLLGFTMHGVQRHAHNIYLEIAAETGIPGITCFVVILVLLVRKLLRGYRYGSTRELRDQALACLATIVIMMTTSLFLSLAYARYYFLIMGFCSAIGRIVLDESTSTLTENKLRRAIS